MGSLESRGPLLTHGLFGEAAAGWQERQER